MEILIIGLLFVALMVYVSTKIKRSAARAYEREEIDTSEFSLVKPDNLMHPIREGSEFLFEAYSKDFGDGSQRGIWRAQAYVSRIERNEVEVFVNKIQKADVIDDNSVDGIREVRYLETNDESSFQNFVRFVPGDEGIYQVKFSILEDHVDQYEERAREFLSSFALK